VLERERERERERVLYQLVHPAHIISLLDLYCCNPHHHYSRDIIVVHRRTPFCLIDNCLISSEVLQSIKKLQGVEVTFIHLTVVKDQQYPVKTTAKRRVSYLRATLMVISILFNHPKT